MAYFRRYVIKRNGNDLPAGFKGWGGEWGELGRDGEYAVKFSVRIGGGNTGGHAGEDSRKSAIN